MENALTTSQRLASPKSHLNSMKWNRLFGIKWLPIFLTGLLVALIPLHSAKCADGTQCIAKPCNYWQPIRSIKTRDCQPRLAGIDSGESPATLGQRRLRERVCSWIQAVSRRTKTRSQRYTNYSNQGTSLDPAAQVQSYIDGVMDGSIVVGRHVRQCVERHLYDLEHAKSRGHYFDEKKAVAAIAWFPLALVHVEGEWAGKPVELTDNQAFIVWCIMGWRRADGTRRFRHVYISCARKWGKSTLAAAVSLLLLTFDDPLEKGAQVYCAATKEEQAKIVHRLAQTMASNSPVLKLQTNVLAKSITTKPESLQPNSFFKPLGSDSRTSDGFNVHAAVLDEIHEWREHHQGLWDKLNTAHGSRRQPLIITITTAGDDTSELWIDVDKLCVTALERYDEEQPPGDNRFVFIARLDEARPCDCGGLDSCRKCDGKGEIPEDDPFDPLNWPKANPNYPVTPKHDFMVEQASDAQNSAKSLHAFKRYHCNIRVTSLDKAIHPVTWANARGELSDWSEADAICGGWDMGGQDDMASLGFCARFATDEPEVDREGNPTGNPVYRFEVDAKCFINTENERDLTKEPFADWLSQNLLVVHQQEINEMRADIVRECHENHIRSWAYDPANSRDFAQSLEPEGIETVKFYQNAGMWTEPLTNFCRDLKKGRIRHDGNGLLAWSAANMITVNMSRAASVQCMPDKRTSPEKIDAIVAVIMAYRLATIAPQRSRGKLFIC